MITRPLNVDDKPFIISLCEQEPEYNIFFLANLDQLVCDQGMVQYWGQSNVSGQMVAILMRYHILWYIYCRPGISMEAFASIIESKAQPSIIVNDNGRNGSSLVTALKNYRIKQIFPGRLRRLSAKSMDKPESAYLTRRATSDDIERLARFYAQAAEDVRRGPESVRRSIGAGRRTFLVEVNGEIVASVLTTAELPGIAMIGGIYAPLRFNDQEYLVSALSEITISLIRENKKVCVVTRDPKVDAICESLRFEIIGLWRMVHMERAT